MAKRIVITSGKGGVGKTTVTANLGCSLADKGLRVALIDLDFGLNNLDVVLGIENRIVFDMGDVFEGRCRAKQALIQHRIKKSLYIMPSEKIKSGSVISGQKIKLMLENIGNIFDYILIDCPAGIDVGFFRAVSSADMALVVVTPTLSSMRDADKVLSILNTYKLDFIGLVINRARGDLMLDGKIMFPKDVAEILKTNVIGVLPEEDEVFLFDSDFPKYAESYKAYKMLADNLVNGRGKLFDVTKKYSGFIGSIKRSIKKSI